MKRLKGKFHLSLEERNGMKGYAFIMLWLIGFIFFFIMPIIESFIYSLSDVKVTTSGMKTAFVGLKNYHEALLVDPNYFRQLVNSLVNMLYEVPIIAMFSMFIACILNQKFKGRTFARVLFFLPVIIASGVSIEILKQGGMSTDINGMDSIYMFKATALEQILTEAGISQKVVMYLTNLVNRIFDISWKSGIQILLFLAGLQTIPSSYYEVSSMEGATRWEEFWKITFPLLSPITLVCVVYTIIDSFTYYQNPVMQAIKGSTDGLKYGYAAAQSWIFFILIFFIIIFVLRVVFRNTVYTEE